MQSTIFLLLAFVMGGITSVYLPMNGVFAKYVNSALLANISFYFLAAITSVFLFSITGNFAAVTRLPRVPGYLYLSGIASAFLILGSTSLIPKLGAGPFFVLFVTGQIIMALVISHFGLLASPQDPMTLKKLIGVAFLITGVLFTTWR